MALRRALHLAALIIAGEAIFGLPFHVARFFRPTLLAGLGLSNGELGALFSAYGVCAMLSYFPGGLLADRLSSRGLMTCSLVMTGLAGIYLATLPALGQLLVVFAFFGVSTILLFWAALIRATRLWGGAERQGLSFGVLEGGRGLVAAALASIALIPYGLAFVGGGAIATHAERVVALQRVLLVYTAATFAAAGLVWALVPAGDDPLAGPRGARPPLRSVFMAPTIWLQGLIVFSAYCAFKAIDNYALYAVAVYGFDEVEGAQISVLAGWIRPFAALGAGLLADRIRPTRAAAICFALLIVGDLAFALAPAPATTLALLWATIAATCGAAFALRGVYPALMQETGVPRALTGAAVGLISVVGFLPDAFMGSLTGWLLDESPGVAGHRHVFALLAALAALGLLASLLLARRAQHPFALSHTPPSTAAVTPKVSAQPSAASRPG